MKLSTKIKQHLCSAVVLSALLIAAPAYAAQELAMDVTLKAGDKIVSTTQVTTPVGKEVEVKVGTRYTLKVLPTLPVANAVAFQVHVLDSNAPPNAFPEVMSTAVRIGDPAKLFNGRKGDQEIEITAKLK